jgi:hypothetical protein
MLPGGMDVGKVFTENCGSGSGGREDSWHARSVERVVEEAGQTIQRQVPLDRRLAGAREYVARTCEEEKEFGLSIFDLGHEGP